RITQREGISEEEALQRIRKRNERDAKRYKEKYDIDITEEKYYDIVIDNSKPLEKSKEEIVKKVSERL
ncbi:MAG: cytidylate kinase family protein, partial [Candidatus Aenigmatarchaeota archaeon]